MKSDRKFIVYWKDCSTGLDLLKKFKRFNFWDDAVDFVDEIVDSNYVFDICVTEFAKLEDEVVVLQGYKEQLI